MNQRPNSQAIEVIVVKVLSQALKRDATGFPLDTRVDELGMDSLTLIGLLGEMEETFGIELDDTGIRGSHTVSSIACTIEAKLVGR